LIDSAKLKAPMSKATATWGRCSNEPICGDFGDGLLVGFPQYKELSQNATDLLSDISEKHNKLNQSKSKMEGHINGGYSPPRFSRFHSSFLPSFSSGIAGPQL
jgi:hypothetical protein